MTKQKNKRVGCALIRVSTNKQDLFGGSLEQQKNMIKRWIEWEADIKNEEFEIKYWFEERNSGKASNTEKRKALKEIRKLMESGLVQFVIFEKIDRLSRDMIFNLQFIKLADKYNIDVYDLESRGLISSKDRIGKSNFINRSAKAEEYSDELEEKISKKAWSAKVNNGKDNSTVPILGLDAHPTRKGMYVINESEQKVVADIAHKLLQTGSYKETVKYCKKKNYRTKKRTTQEKFDSEGELIPSRIIGGREFDSEYIKFLLTNPKLRGKQTFFDRWGLFPDLQDENGYVTANYAHESILPEETWQKLDNFFESVKKTNKKERKRVHLLSGLLIASDGTNFFGEPAKSGKNPYYRNNANDLRYKQEKINNFVMARVKEYFMNSLTITRLFKQAQKDRNLGLPILQERIIDIGKDIQNLENQVAAFSDKVKELVLSGKQDLSVFELIDEEKKKAEKALVTKRKESEDLKDQKKYLLKQMNSSNIEAFMKNGWNKFSKMSDSSKKTFLNQIIHSIVIFIDNPRKIQINLRPDPNGFVKGSLVHNTGARVHLTSKWWSMQDLNLRPPGYEPGALTN